MNETHFETLQHAFQVLGEVFRQAMRTFTAPGCHLFRSVVNPHER